MVIQVLAVLLAPAALAATPTISSFSPTNGPVGTSVTLTGTGFTGANKVEFFGTDATFTVVSDTQITTTVPSGAGDGPISVTVPSEGEGFSSTNFDVTPTSAPTVTSFTPTSGPVGTSVVITGTNFTGATAVRFNGTSATFTVNSATQITATVPSGATDGTISVQNSAGTGTSASSFDVTAQPAPTITSFSPTSGPVGTSVVITGTNFTGATAVRFAGTTATFTVNSPTQITATVPSGANDGTIAVQTSTGTGTSASSFNVTTQPAPTISSFSPTSGPVGTSVVITGTNFTGATAVRFAGTTATFSVNSSTQITATVPSGAGTGAISVTTPSGTATSSSSFSVTAGAPAISSFSPSSGCVGANVTINGTNFTGATAVRFNGVAATSFNVASSTRITTNVPVGATTGPITVTNGVGTGTSSTNFTVTPCAPTITSFSPTSGPVGSSVVITGDDFTGTITVRFDGVNAGFTVNSDTQITATVPTGATTGRITVTNGVGTGTSATDFVVTSTPTITSFSPASGPVGTSVTINGTNFTGITAVRFNGTNATFTVNSSTRITATVPASATTGRITVTNTAGTATSATDFTVVPDSTITSFSPASGRVGQTVVITGTNFTGATSVLFNGIASTFTVNSSTQVTAVVPAGATDGAIAVVGPSGTATSPTAFIVTDVHARSVTLNLSGHLNANGQVIAVDDFQACEDGVAVRIQRRRDGRWRTLKTVTTNSEGSFSTSIRDRKGLYRARAIRLENIQDVCRRATSPARRHRH